MVDRLTKLTHFLTIRSTFSLEGLVRLYIDEIVKLYRVLITIVSDRDPRFILMSSIASVQFYQVIFKIIDPIET